ASAQSIFNRPNGLLPKNSMPTVNGYPWTDGLTSMAAFVPLRLTKIFGCEPAPEQPTEPSASCTWVACGRSQSPVPKASCSRLANCAPRLNTCWPKPDLLNPVSLVSLPWAQRFLLREHRGATKRIAPRSTG